MLPPVPEAGLDARLRARLAHLQAQDRYRSRRLIEGGHGVHAVVDGRPLINFCSNDYLGLATHPQVRGAAQAALVDGCGSTASPLLGGHNRHHRALEDALAEATGYPRALLFTSGWAANLGVLRALLGRDDVLIADELNHASLIDGGRLSGAVYRRVPHADMAAFAAALATTGREAQRMVVTDSVFSMDGDLAPLVELRALTRATGADLMVDDAHGFGVLGARGGGIVEHLGESVRPEVYVATLGKSLGSAGAFVAGSDTLIEYLIQRARSWVFSTAPPPALSAAALAALRIVQGEPERRGHLHMLIARFRARAAAAGLPLMPSETPIQPLVIGRDADALAVSARLMDAGYWVAAIRPPTVPEGTSRLRITLSAAHSVAEVDGLVAALQAAMTTVTEPA
jgi:8-amino-7-oxononanoate synthase